WGETALQLAAYARAEFYLDEHGIEQPIPHVDGGLAVWLRADGCNGYGCPNCGAGCDRDFLSADEGGRCASRIGNETAGGAR
ncbi:hypothetical protein KBZ21_41390, partial [Streptomyces sp. A73]|nr:hypothetical protein [Streptomyces sp. A73]